MSVSVWGDDIYIPKIAVLSKPAVGYIPFARHYRHLFLAMKKTDENIITLGLYPKNLFNAGIIALKNSSKERTKAVIKTNKKEETLIAKEYFDGKKKLSFGGKLETEIILDKVDEYDTYINDIISLAKKYSKKQLSYGYNALFGPNSNTFIDDIIEETGKTLPDIPNAPQQNWGEYELNGVKQQFVDTDE